MVEITFVLIVVMVIVGVTIIRRRRMAWPGAMRRLHAGVPNRAEWMAPDDIVRLVEADYLRAQKWLVGALLVSYTRVLSEAPQYYTGNYLKRQRKAVAQNMHTGRNGI